MQPILTQFRSAAFALVLGVGCATSLEVEPIPISANSDHQITQLALDLSAARSREIDLLSPSWFGRAEAAYAEARELRREEEDVADVLGAVVEGNVALDRAEASADIARTTLSEAWRARTQALKAGAPRLGAPFEQVESEFRELAREIEADDLGDARSGRGDLAARYKVLELRAIKERTLGSTRQILERAQEEGASERVPDAYEAAKRELDQVDALIDRQHYADEATRERAEEARFHVRRAFELNRAIRAIETRGAEAVVLEWERRLLRLEDALGLPDRRDWSFENRWASIQPVASSLRSDRDFVVDQNTRLRSELTDARNEVTRLTGRNRSLAREQEFNELFAQARDHFAPGEAEVYRQAGQLVIRLHALDFPVGEATIRPEDHDLLTKVQRAIRTFGSPRVTIEGHTDSTGGAALNERLSQERADAVRDYLVANYVLPSHRIVAVGRASEDPLASNETPEGRALNRRIDVILDTRRILFIASQ
jgi:outer membrane protein OmpA-like peptidoglycan-associated protein